MRPPTPTMNAGLMPAAASSSRLDYSFLQRLFIYIAIFLVVVAPFTKDPVAFAVGGMVPAVLIKLINTPAMPAAIGYFLVWQWAQVFSRVLLSMIDGETLAGGIYGPTVERAYWYMLASVVVLGVAFRAVLGRLRPPSPELARAHFKWNPNDLVLLYLGTLVVAVFARFGAVLVPGLDQPLDAVSRVKVVALFMLFGTVMSTGKGGRLMILVVLFEIGSGFTGILSEFRGVFIYLAVAALAVRIRWTGTMAFGAVIWISVLVMLALFWTAVKSEFRQLATGSAETQEINMPLSQRLGYLGARALDPSAINWNLASYALISRFAYVDIFGSVIGVQEVAPEPAFMRQWNEAFDHVVKPRFLFPDKAVLSDTEVYVRLARGNAAEQIRMGTSISVGYMAENYADLGFPAMLAGIFLQGLIVAFICRYFMTRQLPWLVGEGLVMGFIFMLGHDGVEQSLPKFLGAAVMYFLVYALAVRFVFPIALGFLAKRAARIPARAYRARP
jgi:hypothetical protein